MTDRKNITPQHVTTVLLSGKVLHKFNFFGEELVLDLFPVGVHDEVLQRASGPSDAARRFREDKLSVAYALRSFGGWNFENSQERREEFVNGLALWHFKILHAELMTAQMKEEEDAFKQRHEILKKSSPDQS
jgi:hypothetical protein